MLLRRLGGMDSRFVMTRFIGIYEFNDSVKYALRGQQSLQRSSNVSFYVLLLHVC